MRMAFGLVSLLVTLAIILLLFRTYQAPVLKTGKSATDDARQIAGRDEDNRPVTDAITLDARDRNGRMEGAVVKTITPGSTLEKFYGFQPGDVILELGPLSVRGNMSSPDEAKDFLLGSYQKGEPVVVMRGPNKLTLPLPPGFVVPPAPAPANDATTATPDPIDAIASQAAADAADPNAAPAAPAAGDGEAPAAKKAPQPKGGLEGQLDIIRNIPGQ